MKLLRILGCDECNVPFVNASNVICTEYDIKTIPGCAHSVCLIMDAYGVATGFISGNFHCYAPTTALNFTPDEFSLFTYWRNRLSYKKTYVEDGVFKHIFHIEGYVLRVINGILHYPDRAGTHSIIPCVGNIKFWKRDYRCVSSSFMVSIIALSLARDSYVNY